MIKQKLLPFHNGDDKSGRLAKARFGLFRRQASISGVDKDANVKGLDKKINQTMAADSKNKNLLMGKNIKETTKNGLILTSLLSTVTGFTKLYKKVADENRAREIYKLRFGNGDKKERNGSQII